MMFVSLGVVELISDGSMEVMMTFNMENTYGCNYP